MMAASLTSLGSLTLLLALLALSALRLPPSALQERCQRLAVHLLSLPPGSAAPPLSAAVPQSAAPALHRRACPLPCQLLPRLREGWRVDWPALQSLRPALLKALRPWALLLLRAPWAHHMPLCCSQAPKATQHRR